LLPREGQKLEGLKASQDNTRAKVAPSAELSQELEQFRDYKLGIRNLKD
jgi:hypothetical protein